MGRRGTIKELGARLLQWAIFGVAGALLPLCIVGILIYVASGAFRLTEIIGGGDLLLVANAICFSALGELSGAKGVNRVSRIITQGAAFIVSSIAIVLYFVLNAGSFIDLESWHLFALPEDRVIDTSLILMLLATVVGFLTVLAQPNPTTQSR